MTDNFEPFESQLPSRAESLARLNELTLAALAKTAHIEDVVGLAVAQAEALLADTQAAQ